jgi:hypothetical protein
MGSSTWPSQGRLARCGEHNIHERVRMLKRRCGMFCCFQLMSDSAAMLAPTARDADVLCTQHPQKRLLYKFTHPSSSNDGMPAFLNTC